MIKSFQLEYWLVFVKYKTELTKYFWSVGLPASYYWCALSNFSFYSEYMAKSENINFMVPLLLVCKTVVEWIFWPWFDFKKALAIWTNHKPIFAKNNRSSRKNRDNIALRFKYSCCCCFFSIYKDMFSHILLFFSCLSGWYAKQFIYETVDSIKEFIVKQGKKRDFWAAPKP